MYRRSLDGISSLRRCRGTPLAVAHASRREWVRGGLRYRKTSNTSTAPIRHRSIDKNSILQPRRLRGATLTMQGSSALRLAHAREGAHEACCGSYGCHMLARSVAEWLVGLSELS
mmetsp:Transcript_7884/g.24747  ORF Transcript_7884/g.24747 Transcript_7884/m.24747 type:complete len:115 (+) Transcript_7884:248-592(+)